MKNPTLQDKLNYANKVVAELMKEVETLKGQKEMFENAHNKGIAYYEELFDSNEKLKSDYAKLSEQFKEVDMTATKLSTDYALLEERSYTQSDNYTELNKMHDDLLDKYNKLSAENYALKAEIERTNRHINLAENQLNKEQQPLVVNHYHNCTINK